MERLNDGVLDNDFRCKVVLRSRVSIRLPYPPLTHRSISFHGIIYEYTFDRVIRVRCAMNLALDYRAVIVAPIIKTTSTCLLFLSMRYIYSCTLVRVQEDLMIDLINGQLSETNSSPSPLFAEKKFYTKYFFNWELVYSN